MPKKIIIISIILTMLNLICLYFVQSNMSVPFILFSVGSLGILPTYFITYVSYYVFNYEISLPTVTGYNPLLYIPLYLVTTFIFYIFLLKLIAKVYNYFKIKILKK
jgi:hypothetical protein